MPWLDPRGEQPLVGSLAVNPADDALWMSTNTGLYRVPRAGGAPERVAGTLVVPGATGRISEQLVVRFTGPDTLLASGHPRRSTGRAAGGARPAALRDAGRSWTAVSELGTADFHAIERSGGRVIGALFGEAQVLVSYDEGANWQGRAAPAVLTDLAVDPDDPARWVATAEDGVFVSRDEGGTWRPVDTVAGAYVAWPAPDALYRIDPGGPVQAQPRRRPRHGRRSAPPEASRWRSPRPTRRRSTRRSRTARSGARTTAGPTWGDHLAPSG